jgi:uncharacterized membrane protein YdjX (TVP38/TMEM64 family)
VAVLGVVALFVAARQLGLFEKLKDPDAAAANIAALGAWGQLAFVATFAIFQPLGVPGTVYYLAAALIWPWAEAFGLSMLGSVLASVNGFSMSRFVLRDWLAPRIPQRLRRYDQALAERAFVTITILRFIFWTAPTAHAFLGVSRVSFRTHLWGTIVGLIIPVALVTLVGQRVFAELRNGVPSWAWASLGGLVVVGLVLLLVTRYRKARAARRQAST